MTAKRLNESAAYPQRPEAPERAESAELLGKNVDAMEDAKILEGARGAKLPGNAEGTEDEELLEDADGASVLTVVVSSENAGVRVDKYLGMAFPDYSRAYFQKLLKDGAVSVDGKPVKANYKVSAGQ